MRRGRPIVSPDAIHGGPTAETVRHGFTVRNAGAATITQLWLWIENDQHETVSSVAGGQVVISPDGKAVGMSVSVPGERASANQRVLVIGLAHELERSPRGQPVW